MDNSLDTRVPFFPHSRSAKLRAEKAKLLQRRNTPDRQAELNSNTQLDAKVNIPDSVRDYSRIKSQVDASLAVDNTPKIEQLKAKIAAGNYEVDYEGLADKMLKSEF